MSKGLSRLVDGYLVYASAALVVMGFVALSLSLLFRRRLKRLDSVAQNSSPSVFHRTFVVFDPYQKTTLFHGFLSFMPFIPIVGGFGVAALLLVIIDSGLLLTLLVVIFSSSLIVVEESIEAHTESKLLITAVKNGADLGVGDIKLLSVTRKLLPRLSYYYLGLAVFFFMTAAVFPAIWTDALLYIAMFFGYLIQASVSAGPAGWLAGIVLYASVITAFLVLISFAKNRLFQHQAETVSL